MSPHLAYALLTGLAFLDLLAGFAIGRGVLERRRDALCRDLAKDLKHKVHQRLDAYRRLEARIAGVIGEFDRLEVPPARETVSLSSRRPVTEFEPAPATPVAAASAEGLSWMDECADVDPPAAVPTHGTHPTPGA
jgi:hypothetical protein